MTQNNPTPARFLALFAVLLLLVAGRSELRAQTSAENPPVKSGSPDELSQAELLKSYLRVREQLHAEELSIVTNRLEAEATARAQAAAITEKLDAIKSVMAAERERQQLDAQRAAAERERQQADAQQANRTVLWAASAIGGVGLLAMLFTALFQWRAINRMTDATALRPQLLAPTQQSLLTAGAGTPSGETVALSNQRLMSVIDRIERRIFELEHTTTTPPIATNSVEVAVEADPVRRTVTSADHATPIAAMLGKGRALLNANKASEAVECYDEVLKLDANNSEALVKKGAALERLKQDLEALQCYDRAIKADHKMTLAYLSKGAVCNRLHRYDEAVECYEQALQAGEVRKG